ncbi:hypothetical protein R6Q59_019643 [Mikania micrantha]
MSRHVKTTPIGIDLGTTYSCVAAWFDQHNRVEIFANEQGNKITPSCVACNDIEVLVGEGAKNQITANPTNTIFGKILHGTDLERTLMFLSRFKKMETSLEALSVRLTRRKPQGGSRRKP